MNVIVTITCFHLRKRHKLSQNYQTQKVNLKTGSFAFILESIVMDAGSFPIVQCMSAIVNDVELYRK